MSVLSRPVRHRATAPTQREVRIPLPRSASKTEAVPSTALTRTPAPRTAAPPARRRIPTALLAAGTVGALALAGGATYLVLEDDGGGATTVIAPAYVPTEADLGRDRAAEARGAGSTSVGVTDATLITEAEKDAAMQRRAQNVQP